MTYTQEYDTWFRETGQFLPPCDLLEPHSAEMERMKQFGAGVYEHLQEEMTEAESLKVKAYEDMTNCEIAFRELKVTLRGCLASETDLAVLVGKMKEVIGED